MKTGFRITTFINKKFKIMIIMLMLPWCDIFPANTYAGEQKTRRIFKPNWESLDSRKSPGWFAKAKLGIFIHWGVFSVPSICDTSTYSEWYWWWYKTNSHNGLVRKFHDKWYGKDFKYQDFAKMFRAELWKPDDWAKLFKRAGARYVVLVSKHHDGFALWPSKEASRTRGYPWNSVEVGPKRDICGELARAIRKVGLRMGFYYSFMEWNNPLYDKDKKKYVTQHMIPQIKDLVKRYKPAVFWPDGEWDYPDTLWRSTEILAWIYNNCDNPGELVVNDRWGKGLRGRSGDYYTTEYGSLGGGASGLKNPNKPFEECRGIGGSFAFNRLENYDNYLSRRALVQLLIDTVSRGGGLLLDVGPTADGRIPVIQQDRLIALGKWLKVNGESIYGTHKGKLTHLPWGKSTTKGNTLYLHVFSWPAKYTLKVNGLMTKIKKAYFLHDPQRKPLPLKGNGTGRLTIDVSGYCPYPNASVIALELESAPVVINMVFPDETGTITLSASQADLSGGLKIESTVEQTGTLTPGIKQEVKRFNIGFWSNPKATARWNLKVDPNQEYKVTIEWACDPGNQGGSYVLEIGGQSFTQKVGTTGSWQQYKSTQLGTVKTGRKTGLTAILRALEIPSGKALINVRKITLMGRAKINSHN